MLAELALQLVGLRTLFRCQHLIELRRSFRPNRDKLTEKSSLLIGQGLNLSVALIRLGGRAQRLPILLKLLTNGLGRLPGLLEDLAALLLLRVRQIELLCHAVQVAPHETTPALLRPSGSRLGSAGGSLREHHPGCERSDPRVFHD